MMKLYLLFQISNIQHLQCVVSKLWENVCFLWVRGYLVGVVGGGVLHNRRENLKLSTNCDAAPVVATGTMVTPWHQVPGQVSGHHLHNVYLCLWSQHLLVITTGHWYVDKWLWSHENINTGYQYNIFMIWFMVLKYGSCDCFCQWINVFTRASIYLNVE